MITICTGPMPVSTAFDLVPLREFLPSRPTGSCWPRRGVLPADAEAREFIAFWLRSGRVLAGMNVNIWDVSDIIQALVRTQVTRSRGTASPRPSCAGPYFRALSIAGIVCSIPRDSRPHLMSG